jgi:hypothetical protein
VCSVRRMKVSAICFFECSVVKFIWKSGCEFLGLEIGADYISVASKWLSKKNFALVNVISTAVLRAVWLTRNDFIFNHQAWSSVKPGYMGQNLEAVAAIEDYVPRCEDGSDDEVVHFPGKTTCRPTADYKRLKLDVERAVDGFAETGVKDCEAVVLLYGRRTKAQGITTQQPAESYLNKG